MTHDADRLFDDIQDEIIVQTKRLLYNDLFILHVMNSIVWTPKIETLKLIYCIESNVNFSFKIRVNWDSNCLDN